jgi:HK97 family phage major capsid protein
MKPKGFLSYDKSTEADEARAFGTIQYFESGSASGFPALSGVPGAANADALFDVVYGLRSGYRSNAAWMMNSATAGYLRKLKDGDGRPLWSESLIQGQPPTLIGYPVEMNEDMPDIGSDDFPIAFADWEAAYTIVDRRGVRVIRDDVTNKPYVGFYTTKRVGGGLIDSRAIKLLKTAAS